jgi:cytoskeletal protein RodZ
MRTKILRYLHKKSHQELKFKSILLAFFTAIFLSACGIKGDLYETPEQPATEQNKVSEPDEISQVNDISDSAESKKKVEKTLDESDKQTTAQQPIEPATTPSDKQSTAPIKE